MAIVGFWVVAPVVNEVMEVSGQRRRVAGRQQPAAADLDPDPSPAKVFFLNNAINHGVLTPLGLAEAAETGKSVLFLLEANPGPGLGLLLAYSFFGAGAERLAPGAAIIQFFGGIHEIDSPTC